MTDKKVLVYVDRNDTPLLVGRLWSHVHHGKESATFEYDPQWLQQPDSFALELALPLGEGSYHTPLGKSLFGSIGDSAPDRWGRILMRRAERLRAEHDGKTPRTLFEMDYLLRVDDEARQGALRFALQEEGPFLATKQPKRIPPLIDLPKLLSAIEKFEKNIDLEEDLKLLLAPGSSLGGARPKASVRDRDNHLAIAKFPQKMDEVNVVLWEALALRLAERAKIIVPEWRIEQVGDKQVLISRRFDRIKEKRIPFMSAMSMLGANDNETHSYLEIAEAFRIQGTAVTEDLKTLWRRIVFNIYISNTDDHLRNHGFLYTWGKGWRLSPAYDLNPVPIDIKPRILSTTIDLDDGTASVELALEVSSHFALTKDEATKIVKEVETAVSGWREAAKRLGLTTAEIKRMDSAFLVH